MARVPAAALSIARFQEELDRLFREATSLLGSGRDAGRVLPPVDVMEAPETVEVLVEVPGVAPDELRVEIAGRTLTVAGTKRPRPPEGNARYHRLERSRGAFERTVELTGPVNTRDAVARLEGGILTVTLPKVREKRTARSIPVIEERGDETT